MDKVVGVGILKVFFIVLVLGYVFFLMYVIYCVFRNGLDVINLLLLLEYFIRGIGVMLFI